MWKNYCQHTQLCAIAVNNTDHECFLINCLVLFKVRKSDKQELVINRLEFEGNNSPLYLKELQRVNLSHYSSDVRDIEFLGQGDKGFLSVLAGADGWTELKFVPFDSEICTQEFYHVIRASRVMPTNSSIKLIRWSRNGSELAMLTDDQTIKIRSVILQKDLITFSPLLFDSDYSIEQLEFSHDACRIVIIGRKFVESSGVIQSAEKICRLLDSDTGRLLSDFTKDTSGCVRGNLDPLLGKFGRVEGLANGVAFYAVYRRCYKNKSDCLLVNWEATCFPYKIKRAVNLPLKAGLVTAMTVIPSGRYIGLGFENGTVSVYIAFGLQSLFHTPMKNFHTNYIKWLSFLPSSFSADRGHELELISVSIGPTLNVLEGLTGTDGQYAGDERCLHMIHHCLAQRDTISYAWVLLGALLLIVLFFYVFADIFSL